MLLEGETGTGKELFARAVHNASPRRDRVLVKVNCATLPANLIESELFGHEKGAFTGAVDRRIGKFELAHGGTLFLDEVGELPPELQPKLLRALQEKEIERVSGRQTIRCDVRIIAATNRGLGREVRAGRFRADLFYRLSVFPVRLPALRERIEDVPLLTNHFLRKFAKRFGKNIRSISPVALEQMQAYDCPNSVRELEHLLEQSIILCQSAQLELSKFFYQVRAEALAATVLVNIMQEVEQDNILAVLKAKGRMRGKVGARTTKMTKGVSVDFLTFSRPTPFLEKPGVRLPQMMLNFWITPTYGSIS